MVDSCKAARVADPKVLLQYASRRDIDVFCRFVHLVLINWVVFCDMDSVSVPSGLIEETEQVGR
jgi:hypothetical protein